MLTQLPPEIVLVVTSYLDLACVTRLSSTCHHLKLVAHRCLVRRLRELARRFSDLRDSLARLGWNREEAADHSPWSCPCMSLLLGPWLVWEKRRLVRKETSQEQDTNVMVGAGCVVANDRIFSSPSAKEVVARSRSGKMKEVSQLVNYQMGEYNLYPLYLTAHQNTLVVKTLTPAEGFRRGEYSIEIYNSQSQQKVCDLNPSSHVTDVRSLSRMEIADICMSDNTIVVHLMFDNDYQDDQEEGEDDVFHPNETQIWSISTSEPSLASLSLVRTVDHPLSLCSLQDPGLVSVNNRLLVRVGTPSAFSTSSLQWFHRSRLKGGPHHVPVGVLGQTWDQTKVSVRGAWLGGGDSAYIALTLELSIDHRNPDHSYQIVVQVYQLEQERMVVEEDFGTSNHVDEKVKLAWFGPHLLVLARDKQDASVHSWQEGQAGFRTTKVRLKAGSVHWTTEFFHADYEGFVLANVNFGLEKTTLVTYSPRPEI